LRDAAGDEPLGVVDAVSHGFGKGDPEATPTETSAGTLPPGNLGSFPYTERRRGWGPEPAMPVEDRLELELTNLKRVVVNARRAKLSCDAELAVTTDGPVTVKLAGCGRREHFG
jgi:hypothetical protein